MKSIKEHLEEQKLAELYPAIIELEKKLVAQGIDPDEYFLDIIEQQKFNELLDPQTLAMLGYGAYRGYNALGGYNGIKSLAQKGWEGLKNTGQQMMAQHQANQYHMNRDAAQDAYAKAGGQGQISGLPAYNAGATSKVQQFVNNMKKQVSSLPLIMQGADQDPQVKQAMSQFTTSLDFLANRLGQLPTQ